MEPSETLTELPSGAESAGPPTTTLGGRHRGLVFHVRGTGDAEQARLDSDLTASLFETTETLTGWFVVLPRRLKTRLWQEVAQDHDRICVDPSVMGGQPVIGETRIPVYLIVQLAAEGRSLQEIVDNFEGDIGIEDVQAALSFAADLAR